MMFALSLYFIVDYQKLPSGGTFCGPVWPAWEKDLVLARVYFACLTLLSYILPLAVISWTFLALSLKLNESSKFIKTMKSDKKETETANLSNCSAISGRKHAIRLVQNRRAKRILTPVVLVFTLFMLPLTVLRLCVVFWPAIASQTYYDDLFFTVVVCAIINSSANPVIYSMVRLDFRRQLMRRIQSRRRSSTSQGFLFPIELGMIYRLTENYNDTPKLCIDS